MTQVGTAPVLPRRVAGGHCGSELSEALVRAIFPDWFVDFGPTRAKRRVKTYRLGIFSLGGPNPRMGFYEPPPIWLEAT